MYIEDLRRHLAVCSRTEAERQVKADPGFWHVISISSPTSQRACLDQALSIHRIRVEDTEDPRDPEAVSVPRPEVIEAALRYARETTPAPLLIHCQMGWSRSTAIALLILIQGLEVEGYTIDQICDVLLSVREKSRPNLLIISQGLSLILPPEEAAAALETIRLNPRFSSNRIDTSKRPGQT